MSRKHAVGGVVAVLLLAGADGGGCKGDREIPVRVVGAGIQCGGGGDFPVVKRLADEPALVAALSVGGVAPAKVPEIDWAKEAVVLITDGQKPTGGYAVELASAKAPVKDGAAGIKVAFTVPQDGMMTAQVVTSPCLVVAIPTEGLTGVGAMVRDRVVAKTGL
ncbi:MAG: protease complex subunit PrcB family protein [Anaeromyxobacteraceae bacterium]